MTCYITMLLGGDFMDKTESIARRIFGWALNRWDRWYDVNTSTFIHTSEFQPEEKLEHAMLIVERMECLGFTFTRRSSYEVSFNNVTASGDTLAQAITNAAYTVVENQSTPC